MFHEKNSSQAIEIKFKCRQIHMLHEDQIKKKKSGNDITNLKNCLT